MREWLEARAGDEVVDLVVSIPESMRIPRFSEPDTSGPRDEESNRRALARAGEIVEELRERRRGTNAELTELLRAFGGEIKGDYWLVPAVRVALPLAAVEELLGFEIVRYIEPASGDELPPANANPNDDVDDARSLIQSDPYFNQGLTSGWIGLLDTGVHDVTSCSRIPTGSPCGATAPRATRAASAATRTTAAGIHGTSAAGIISGNGNQGNPQRGVTAIRIDSWKVYPDNGGNCGGLGTDATVRAFEQAVRWLDRSIVAEMQGGGNASSAISPTCRYRTTRRRPPRAACSGCPAGRSRTARTAFSAGPRAPCPTAAAARRSRATGCAASVGPIPVMSTHA